MRYAIAHIQQMDRNYTATLNGAVFVVRNSELANHDSDMLISYEPGETICNIAVLDLLAEMKPVAPPAPKPEPHTEEFKRRIATQILPFLRDAVRHQIERWDAEREIEKILGTEIDDMPSLYDCHSTGLTNGDDVDKMTIEDALEFVKDTGVLEEE